MAGPVLRFEGVAFGGYAAAMNDGLPMWRRVLAIAAMLLIVGAVWWVARGLIYEWLPRDVALIFSIVVIAVIFGADLVQRLLRKKVEQGRHSGTARDRRQRLVRRVLDS